MSVQLILFENDVKMYGTQARELREKTGHEFENDVKMYGTQAFVLLREVTVGLRMM